uniref:Uncharacterized protein n=1 Tax=Cucumis sativus TaxID=3659 RepID=A0A0A0LUN7_CUCSA
MVVPSHYLHAPADLFEKSKRDWAKTEEGKVHKKVQPNEAEERRIITCTQESQPELSQMKLRKCHIQNTTTENAMEANNMIKIDEVYIELGIDTPI